MASSLVFHCFITANIIRRVSNLTGTLGFNIGQSIHAANGIVLGDRVRLGPRVKLVPADHDILDFDKHVSKRPIEIESFCWLGANVVVLPGVHLAEHTIVAAGAVVTKSFLEGNCVIAEGVQQKSLKISTHIKDKDQMSPSYPISENALRWLELILKERFGHSLKLAKSGDTLQLSLEGRKGKIVFDNLSICLTEAHSNQPCSLWDAQAEDGIPY